MTTTATTTDRFVRVFISHKSEDQNLAYRLRDILERDCNSLRCYVAGTDYGVDWRDTIEHELGRANLLLLLFTSPAREWDWPLYEVGLYQAQRDRAGKIIYFYQGGERPGPLQHLHGVAVDRDNPQPIVEFLRQFYRGNEIVVQPPPLCPDIADDVVAARAKEICVAFATTQAAPLFPSHRVVLVDPRRQADDPREDYTGIPRDFRVEAMSPPTPAIFDRVVAQGTWQEMLDCIEEEPDWKLELDQQFLRAVAGKTSFPTKSTFRAVDQSRIFRAMITRIDKADGRVLRVAITFVPEHLPSRVGGPSFNLLRFATRFRTEVIEKYRGELTRADDPQQVATALRSLMGAVASVEREACDFGLMEQRMVQAAFSETNGDRARVAELFGEWEAIRGHLEQAAEAKSAGDTLDLLERMRYLNLEFLNMVAERHRDLIANDFAAIRPAPARRPRAPARKRRGRTARPTARKPNGDGRQDTSPGGA